MPNYIYLYLLIFISSVLLTALLRVYALKKNVIDIPNDRSSHVTPTPRGGGVSIVITFIITLLLSKSYGLISFNTGAPLLISGLLVAVVGFIDDHRHIDAKWRLSIHLLAALLVVYALNGLPLLELFGFSVDLGIAGYFLAVIAIVWILNLFNFMDGIDGIAGIEAISSTFFAGLFLSFISNETALTHLHWYLTAASLGFLMLNFPPAKIFMGDAGSGFLGFMLACLALISSHVDQVMLWVWLVLLGVFIVDATFTVIRRFIRKEKVHEAHRSHAYQFVSRQFKSHLKVTIAVLLINILWLAPIAYLIATKEVDGLLGLIMAYLPLILLAIKFKAGAKEYV